MSKLDEVFKAYIITRDKIPVAKYRDPINQYTHEQVKAMPEYSGLLGKNTVLVDIDEPEEGDILLNIIKSEGLKCRVHRTNRGGIHAFFIGHHMDTSPNKTFSAIGLNTDWKLGSKSGFAVLKQCNKEREVIYDTDEIGELPKWLYPISKNPPKFLSMKDGDGRNQILFSYILTLQKAGFTNDEIKETIHIINKYIFRDQLSEREINTILRDEAFPSQTFYDNKNKLKVREFEEHFCREVHAVKLNNKLHIYSNGVYVNAEDKIRGRMLDYLPDLSFNQRTEILNRSKDRIQVNAEFSPSNYFLFRNCVYNIETDESVPHDPKFIIPNMIPWNYNPNAYSAVADKALNQWACNDVTLRNLLEEVIGYCMLRDQPFEKAFFLLGDNSNGKSTYLNVLRHLLGNENIMSIDLQRLDDKFKTAELDQKMANIGADIPDTWVADAGTFKKLTSCDMITVEEKHKAPKQFTSYATQVLSANTMPRITDKTGAIKRRLVLVPFKAKFDPSDPDFDPYIKNKLRTPEAVEYLIKIGIEGLKRAFRNNGFSTTDEMLSELKEIDVINNPILEFIDDVGEDGIINEDVQSVYDTYREFCYKSGITHILIRNQFTRQINNRLGTQAKRRKVNGKEIKIFVKK